MLPRAKACFEHGGTDKAQGALILSPRPYKLSWSYCRGSLEAGRGGMGQSGNGAAMEYTTSPSTNILFRPIVAGVGTLLNTSSLLTCPTAGRPISCSSLCGSFGRFWHCSGLIGFMQVTLNLLVALCQIFVYMPWSMVSSYHNINLQKILTILL